MGELGTIFSKPDQGRTDELGHREFTVRSKMGSKGAVYYATHRNPLFSPPKTKTISKIDEAWFTALVTKLRQERQSCGLSQATLAGLLKTKQSAISNFESGRTNPSLVFLIRYSRALGKKIIFSLNA